MKPVLAALFALIMLSGCRTVKKTEDSRHTTQSSQVSVSSKNEESTANRQQLTTAVVRIEEKRTDSVFDPVSKATTGVSHIRRTISIHRTDSLTSELQTTIVSNHTDSATFQSAEISSSEYNARASLPDLMLALCIVGIVITIIVSLITWCFKN